MSQEKKKLKEKKNAASSAKPLPKPASLSLQQRIFRPGRSSLTNLAEPSLTPLPFLPLTQHHRKDVAAPSVTFWESHKILKNGSWVSTSCSRPTKKKEKGQWARNQPAKYETRNQGTSNSTRDPYGCPGEEMRSKIPECEVLGHGSGQEWRQTLIVLSHSSLSLNPDVLITCVGYRASPPGLHTHAPAPCHPAAPQTGNNLKSPSRTPSVHSPAIARPREGRPALF